MMTPDIHPVELKVFLNHIYELKKGVRQMVLYTTNKRYEDFAVKRLVHRRYPPDGDAPPEPPHTRRGFHLGGHAGL